MHCGAVLLLMRKAVIVNFAERRRAERFNGVIPIELEEGRGVTRDFSIEGVYFVTDRLLDVGEQVDFTMHLNHIDPVWPVRLRCRGEVVRVERGLEMTGVAVTITTHRFEGAPGLA